MDLRKGYEFEQAASVRMSGHPDSKEALTAFRERRESRYQPLARPSRWLPRQSSARLTIRKAVP
jgi:enoyl-CoA hydratase